jgi:hypothetical protein
MTQGHVLHENIIKVPFSPLTDDKFKISPLILFKSDLLFGILVPIFKSEQNKSDVKVKVKNILYIYILL